MLNIYYSAFLPRHGVDVVIRSHGVHPVRPLHEPQLLLVLLLLLLFLVAALLVARVEVVQPVLLNLSDINEDKFETDLYGYGPPFKPVNTSKSKIINSNFLDIT